MSNETGYSPPRVWIWEEESGGRFASINRPVAGPTHEQELPVGEHAFQLYSLATPNGVKVTILFEELLELGHSDAEYDAWPIRIFDGEQFSSGFVAVNPNSKIPAMVDHSGPEPVRVFESGSIVLHLSPRNLVSSCRTRVPRGRRRSTGCSGRWAAHLSLEAVSAISTLMHRSR